MTHTEDPKSLLGLLACVAALLLWVVGDGWKNERLAAEQRKSTAVRLIARQALAAEVSAQAPSPDAKSAREVREGLLAAMRVEKGLQSARAEAFYELRQQCEAVKLRCTIRLAEPGLGARGRAEASAVDLEGVQRLRARMSGTLAEQELQSVLEAIALPMGGPWRVMQIQLKGRGFELELERLVAVPAPAAQREGQDG